MQAVRIERTGGPEVLAVADVPDPAPGPGEVVVEVAAAGLNFIDTYHRSGLYDLELPVVLGLEGAGEVVDVGEGVTDPAVGDRVAWATAMGSYAERVVVPVDAIMRVPSSLEVEVAAALPLQGMTAHYLARDSYPLAPGDRCLVHAAAGGVGHLLVQVASLLGAEVFATVGTEEKAELATAAGADHTILYRERDFAEAVREIAGEERPLDVVYDGVGQATFHAGLGLIRPRGTMVTFGNASGPVEPISPLLLSEHGSLFLTRPTLFHHAGTRDEVQRRGDELVGWIEAGDLDVRVGDRFPLAAAADAHRALEARRTTGKVLLLP